MTVTRGTSGRRLNSTSRTWDSKQASARHLDRLQRAGAPEGPAGLALFGRTQAGDGALGGHARQASVERDRGIAQLHGAAGVGLDAVPQEGIDEEGGGERSWPTRSGISTSST